MKKLASVFSLIALLVTSCGTPAREDGQYNSTTGAFAAGVNAGETLLALNPNKDYSKAWFESKHGKIVSGPGVISLASRSAFQACSDFAQIAYPMWREEQHDDYMDHLAGCQMGLGWNDADTGLTDLSAR